MFKLSEIKIGLDGLAIALTVFVLIFLAMNCFGQGVPGTVRFPANLDTQDSLFRAANAARTTLSGAVNNSDTTITVANPGIFSPSGVIVIDSEIIYYTAKSGSQLTGLLRAQEATAAASHSLGATVRGAIVAGYHNAVVNSLIQVQSKLGTGGSAATNGSVLQGNGTGSSGWTDTPFLTRLKLNGATAAATPPSLGVGGSTRLLLYDASESIPMEYMGAGVESGGFWLNNVGAGSYKFYFGGATPSTLSRDSGLFLTGKAYIGQAVPFGPPNANPTAAGVSTRILLYDAGNAGEYMGSGVESGAWWFNNVSNGSYKFYFGTANASNWTYDNLKLNGTVQLGDPGAKPTCNAANRLRIWADASPSGTKDTVEICARDNVDVYAWRTIY